MAINKGGRSVGQAVPSTHSGPDAHAGATGCSFNDPLTSVLVTSVLVASILVSFDGSAAGRCLRSLTRLAPHPSNAHSPTALSLHQTFPPARKGAHDAH
jgi:hypothetical protein